MANVLALQTLSQESNRRKTRTGSDPISIYTLDDWTQPCMLG